MQAWYDCDCGVEQEEHCGAGSDRQPAATKQTRSAWHQLSHGFAAKTDDGFLAPDTSPEYVWNDHPSGTARLAFDTFEGEDPVGPTAGNCVA